MTERIEDTGKVPGDIKAAAVALVVSCVFSLVARTLDYLSPGENSYGSSVTITFSIIWIGIITWLVWDVTQKRRDIRFTLAFVSIIMFAGNALALMAGEFTTALLFHVLEFVVWIGAFYFLSTAQAKDWYQGPKA